MITLIAIPAATTRRNPRFNSNADVWGSIENGTEWPNGIAILMSFVAVIWTLSGYDAPFHLCTSSALFAKLHANGLVAEECSNAAVAVPKAIAMTATSGGLLGWFLMLVIAYTVIDIPAAIGSDVGQPFIAYLRRRFFLSI